VWPSPGPRLMGLQTVTSNPFSSSTALLVSPGILVLGGGTQAVGIATGGQVLDPAAPWPTPRGGADQRAAANGQ
jgi:hypothetical protein